MKNLFSNVKGVVTNSKTKLNKIIAILIILSAIIIVGIGVKSYADNYIFNANDPIYTIKSSAGARQVWPLEAVNSEYKNIFCLNAGASLYRGVVLTDVRDLYNNEESIKAEMFNCTERTGLKPEQNYRCALWIIDNTVFPTTNSELKHYMFENVKEIFGGEYTGKVKEIYEDSNYEDLLEAVQQAAIWRYTKNKTNVNFMTSITGNNITIAEQNAAKTIYNKLVSEARKAVVNNNYQSPNTVDYDARSLKFISSDAVIEGNKVGPFYIDGYNKLGKNNFSYTVHINGSQKETNNYKIEEIEEENRIKLYVVFNEGILPSNGDINVSINCVCKVVKTTGNIIYNGNKLNTLQPVVSINKELTYAGRPLSVSQTEYFDLHLSKNIVQVYKPTYDNNEEIIGYEPKYNNNELDNREVEINTDVEESTFEYKTNKYPVSVSKGDIVKYKITVHNEGEVDGYATKITDYMLSSELEKIDETEVEAIEGLAYQNYGWVLDTETQDYISNSEQSNVYSTTYLENSVINAYSGDTVDSVEVYIYCRVKDTAKLGEKLKNVAEITQYGYGNPFKEASVIGIDRDSVQDTILEGISETFSQKIKSWKGSNTNRIVKDGKYDIKGIEDDDDFETVKIEEFDLALTKEIIKVNDVDVVDRRLHINDLCLETLDSNGNRITTSDYYMDKTPVAVEEGDIVTYEITIYNESNIKGYAKQITDYLPEGLALVEYTPGDNSINDTYGWIVDATDSNIVRTGSEWSTEELDYLDGESVQIQCVVTEDVESGDTLLNVSEITQYGYGDPLVEANAIGIDRDSIQATVISNTETSNRAEMLAKYEEKTENLSLYMINKKEYHCEDDDDFEQLKVRSTEFDLVLRKFITKVNSTNIENRTPVVDESLLLTETTASYKHEKTPIEVVEGDLVTYKLRVYNEGKVDGYAEEIIDYLPECLQFVKIEDEYSDDYEAEITQVITNGAEKVSALAITYNGTTKLEPDDLTQYQEIGIVCKVTNIKDIPIGNLIVNRAEISKDRAFNNDGTENTSIVDRDSYINSIFTTPVIANPTLMLDADKLEILNINPLTNPNYYHIYEEIAIYNMDGEYFKGLEGDGSDISMHQDDIDFETIKINRFDLALRKFITEVDGSSQEIQSREPNISNSAFSLLQNGTANYYHTKAPITVGMDSVITYNIRVYNEGNINGYAKQITDYLPEGLELVEYTEGDQSINDIYGWKVDENNSKIITTDYLKDTEIIASRGALGFLELSAENLKDEFWADVKVQCKVTGKGNENNILVNVAEITQYGYGTPFKQASVEGVDRDSIQDNVFTKQTNYSDIETYYSRYENQVMTTTSESYLPGIEDDDDFENVKVEIINPDLSLEKFITGVTTQKTQADGTKTTETREITDRIPKFSKDATVTKGDGYVYKPLFDELKPVEVCYSDIVTYTLRIYNEGQIKEYASEITDDVPDGLEFVPYTDDATDTSINKQYRWVMYKEVTDAEIAELPAGTIIKQINGKRGADGDTYSKCIITTDPKEADYIVTDYLSKTQGEARMSATDTVNPNLLLPFDETAENALTSGPDYRDIKIQFKVTRKVTTLEEADEVIINYAQISDDSDENDEEVEDIDSNPNIWVDEEDDQDREKIRVKYFDLTLVKWVSEAIIIEDGVESVKPGNKYEDLKNKDDHRLIYALYPETQGEYTDLEPVVEVVIPKNKLDSTVVKFKYQIRVANQGQIDGYVKEITDYIPRGMKFVQEDNPLWKETGDGKVVTDQLANTLLTVDGEAQIVEIIYTWINGEKNLGLMVNMAEISEDYNDTDTPDVDSKPNNTVVNEDDIDDAPVLISVRTGDSIDPTYIIIAISTVGLIAVGIILIKKYVL